MPDTTPCSSCGADILWAKTEKGNVMPLDAEPVAGGNVTLTKGVATVHGGNLFEGEGLAVDTPHYRSHFATCPNAQKHRKPK